MRLTAQSILAEHVRDYRAVDKRSTDPPDPRFWPGIRLNLAGATLIDFNLEDGVLADANFGGATFTGGAQFGGATFTGSAQFGGATFTSDANFIEAAFTGGARFGGATFTGAQFGGATFTNYARFGGATFSDGENGLSFDQSTVTLPNAQHYWPTGWRLRPDGSGGYTVVRAAGGLETVLKPEEPPAAGTSGDA